MPEETMDQLVDEFVRLAGEPLPSKKKMATGNVLEGSKGEEVPSFRELMIQLGIAGASNPYLNEKRVHESKGGGKISKRKKSKRKKSKRRRSKTRRRSK